MSSRLSLQLAAVPDRRWAPRCARALVRLARAALCLVMVLVGAMPALAGSGAPVTGGGSHPGGGSHTGHSSSQAAAKTPSLSAPAPRVIIFQANPKTNGLTRSPGISAIARDTSAPMQSRPVLHPLLPGTFSALTVHNPNATVNFQVLVVGGQRVIVPNGLAQQPKSFAFKPGDLPLGKFPRLERGGSDAAIQTPFHQLNFHAPPPAPIQTRFFFPSALASSPAAASALFAGGGVQPLSEFDDLYQFLWFAVFLAAVGSVIFCSMRAISRAT